MVRQVPGTSIDYESLEEAALVGMARAGRRGAFREITRRCNRRLFRIARSVVHDDAEAEDVVQAAYVAAFEHLPDFRGESSLATWPRPSRSSWSRSSVTTPPTRSPISSDW